MFKSIMLGLAALVASFAVLAGGYHHDGDSLDAMWNLQTRNATSAFGPAGTEALIGNMSNNKLRVKIGGVLDVQEQALGSVAWDGVLGKNGVPLGVDTGILTRIEGALQVRVRGGVLCLTGDCPPPAE